MRYAILRPEGQQVGGIFWKDLKTVRGYINRASKVRSLPNVGQYLVLRVYDSEHPDYPYGNDKLIACYRILNVR